jgi:CO/xanthine dehydrogenase FAD-binding subunit
VLRGSRLDDATIERAANAWTERAHPLARNEWKVDAACGLLARALETMR